MVVYTCEICEKLFKKKSHYIDHTENKKKPCIQNKTLQIDGALKNSNSFQTIPNYSNPFQSSQDQNSNIYLNNTTCNYCLKNFSTTFNLNKHVKNSCKVKQLDEEKKETIFNNLLEKEKYNLLFKNIELQQKSIEQLQKINKDLEKKIKDLEKKNKEQNKNYDDKIKQIITKNINNNNYNNTTNNTNNTNTINNTINNNNIIIPSDKLVNFGKEDLSKIDYKKVLGSITGIKFTGYHIFIELLKLIHFNPELPQYQNVYMTDKNREKYMVFQNNNWELSESGYLRIMDHIEDLIQLYEIEFEELKQDTKFKIVVEKLNKFYGRYYLGDDEGNKNKEFIGVVDANLKEFLYNNREVPKKNYIKIKDELVKKSIEKINLDSKLISV